MKNINNTVLVTGGGGYIGSHVVEQLLNKNYKVKVLDKFIFGKDVLLDFINNKNLELIEGDATDLYKLSLSLKDVDIIVHLAGLVGDPACSVDLDLTTHMNIVSTKMIKELAKSLKIKRFIFASSCSVYGASDELVNETSKLNPVSLYAKTKIDSEKELLKKDSNDIHPIILRFATVFGHSRRPRFDLVTNFFTAQAFIDGLITVKGSQQWRPFIHVSDIARAIIKIIEAPINKVDRQVFNVGDDSLNTTIGDLATTVKSIIKKNINNKEIKISINDDIDDPRNYKVSFKKIKNTLGFNHKISLNEGIMEMYENYKKGFYKKNYRDINYINVEMTKLLESEFKSDSYREKSFSTLSSL